MVLVRGGSRPSFGANFLVSAKETKQHEEQLADKGRIIIRLKPLLARKAVIEWKTAVSNYGEASSTCISNKYLASCSSAALCRSPPLCDDIPNSFLDRITVSDSIRLQESLDPLLEQV